MIILIALIAALIFLVSVEIWLKSKTSKNKAMNDFSDKIRQGAKTFLKTEYKVLAIVVIIISVIIAFFNYSLSITFFLGSLFSLIIGRVGMLSATKANVLTADACKKDTKSGLRIAYLSGLKASILAMFLGLIAILILYSFINNSETLYGFAFGASLVALFMRVGGGIFTKSADLAADLVGKIEKNLPEDSPKNPATIADLVGDNVGDVAGMSADLFESYVASIVAAMVISLALGIDILIPATIASIGIISCIASILVIHQKNVYNSMIGALLFSGILILILSYILLPEYFLTILYGLVGGLIIGFSVFYFTSNKYQPTKNISESAKSGAALNVLAGLSNGLLSTIVPVIVVTIIMILSYIQAAQYGIVISAVSMLSILGVVLASTIFGSITDNASGISELSKNKTAKINASKLDSVGNTTAAVGKGFTISSAALTVITLLSGFIILENIQIIDILNIQNLAALFIGALIPFIFSSLVINSVEKTSSKLVDNVRKQFRRNKKTPNYQTPIKIATQNSIKQMIKAVLISILIVVLVGVFLGTKVLASLMVGSVITAFLLSIFMANAGGSMDNAKKLIEEKNYGSEVHKNAVVGDGVGDPLKDTAGPSLNILIKLIAIISLLFAMLF